MMSKLNYRGNPVVTHFSSKEPLSMFLPATSEKTERTPESSEIQRQTDTKTNRLRVSEGGTAIFLGIGAQLRIQKGVFTDINPSQRCSRTRSGSPLR